VRPVNDAFVGALAVSGDGRKWQPVMPVNGELRWVPPAAGWELRVIEHQFRTSPTRYIYHPTGDKDRTYSVCDYLNPAATQAFLQDVHEQYRKYLGAEFGGTVRGFFGDEPDYSLAGIAWTPALFAEFERRKGYDVRPLIPGLFAPVTNEKSRRAKDDYWDVWSAMFRDNFFRPQAEWCARYGMEYTVHLNHEELLLELARSEGDFFRDMRYVQMPAVDAIWRQVWMDQRADYPKLASSAAHLWGRQRAMTESFAIYGNGLTLEQAKWVVDQQFVRGINCLLTYAFAPGRDPHPQTEQAGALVQYVNRASYLLSQGTPVEKIALYVPSRNFWLGDGAAEKRLLDMTSDLLSRQRDFDYIDEQAIAGNTYAAVLAPEGSLMSDAARAMIRGRDKLPPPDVSLAGAQPAVRYQHRRWADADLYFFFNEGADRVMAEATVEGRGDAQVWNAETAEIRALPAPAAEGGRIRVPLTLDGWESKFIVVGRDLPAAATREEPAPFEAEPLLSLAGDWSLQLGDRTFTTPLRTWAELGLPAYSGTAHYRKEFNLPAQSKPVYLEATDVRYSARIWLNGVDLGTRPWRPFRWEITKALKAGSNVLEVEVRNTGANAFAGDPQEQARLKAQAAATKGSYLDRSLPFDLEMLPSGLLPDVRIVTRK
jgi:hypothetical protein